MHRGLRDRCPARGRNQLRRLALRPLLGLARTGSYAAEGSGEIGLAFTTSADRGQVDDRELNAYFAAAYEAAQEAVYNCLVAARPASASTGPMQEAFPIDAVRHARGSATAEALAGWKAERGLQARCST